MISVRSGLRILVTTSPVDFRRGMDSLAMLVTDTLRGDLSISVRSGPRIGIQKGPPFSAF
jgi:hypothetical protein